MPVVVYNHVYMRWGTQKGFTIVELLIVIVVIAILAAISVTAYTGVQTRSKDNKRAADIATIEKALRGYEAMHGGLPVTWAYGGSALGGWNYSTLDNWLTFLEEDFGKMPRDSENSLNGETDPNRPNARVYFYYCYPSSSQVEPDKPTVHLGYHKQNGGVVRKMFVVQSCLSSLPE